MSLISPNCKNNFDTKQGEYLEFFIIDNNGVKTNLLTIPGITILGEGFEIHYEINKQRSFKFSYKASEENELNNLLANKRNEIQIIKNGDKIVFDGYVQDVVSTEVLNNKLAKFNVSVIGTENIFYTDYVKGLTSFVNLTSKEIIERVANEYTKFDDNRLRRPVVSDLLKTKWLEALNIDGQYSRLFDMIKERENCQYQFEENGKVTFFLESELSQGNDLFVGDNWTIPAITNQHQTANNRGTFKFKDVRGALAWEKIQVSTKGEKNENKVKVMNNIYDIKGITVNGQSGWKKSINGTEKNTYSFSNNEITFNGGEDFSLTSVKVFYWIKNTSGVVILDDEKSIIDSLKIRKQSGSITSQEYSNERVSSIQDVYGLTQKQQEFSNRPQYKVSFTILDLNTDNDLTNNFVDFHRYNWVDSKWFPFLKDVEYFVPHEKTIKLRVFEGCNSDRINTENFQMTVVLESDQSNRWQNESIRDKNQNERHEQNTINIVLNHEWDLGNCPTYDAQFYTKDNLITQTTMAVPFESFPKNHVDTKEKLVEVPASNHIENTNTNPIKCLEGNNAYLRGFVWYKATGFPIINNQPHSRMLIVPAGTTDIQQWLGTQNILDTDQYDQELYLKVGNHWRLWVKDTNHIIYETPDNVPTPDVWVKIPVDARIFDRGTDNLSRTWDANLNEWGITGRNSAIRRHGFYYDPFNRVASLYPITKDKNSDVPIEHHTEAEWSAKFTDWTETWYTSLNQSPFKTWSEKSCNLLDNYKNPTSADAKTGQSNQGSIADRITDRVNSGRDQSIFGI